MNLRADVSAAVLILFIWISCSCCTAHPSSQISISTKPLHGLHIPTRQMITTLTIVFGVFGLLLLLALALLFLHFFVTDLSDYILCCCRITGKYIFIRKKATTHIPLYLWSEETNQSSNSAGQKIYRWLCYATRRCNRNTTSASRNCRSIVYRPYSAQRNSSSNLPTCLNFR